MQGVVLFECGGPGGGGLLLYGMTVKTLYCGTHQVYIPPKKPPIYYTAVSYSCCTLCYVSNSSFITFTRVDLI